MPSRKTPLPKKGTVQRANALRDLVGVHEERDVDLRAAVADEPHRKARLLEHDEDLRGRTDALANAYALEYFRDRPELQEA